MTIEKRERCGGTEGKTKPIQRGTITAFSGYAPCPGCHSCDPQNWCACGERLQADPDNYYHPFRPKPHASGTPLREECKEQALRDAGGEDVPRDDSAASSTPSPCTTCGSVDGVPLWANTGVLGHGRWHVRESSCLENKSFWEACHACPSCSTPKQEQPEAGLLTVEQVKDRIVTVGWAMQNLPPVEGDVEMMEALRTAKSALIEVALLREQNSYQGSFVFSLEGKVKRLRDALLKIDSDPAHGHRENRHWCAGCIAREALKE